MVAISTKDGVHYERRIKVVTTDACTNGVIHVIDTVLMPHQPDFQERLLEKTMP
jgi:uncharacterized surface protein with fasciclin (FAS1) repeats